VTLLVACALSGCAMVDRWNPSKRAAKERAQQLQSLQLSVMRFADEYVGLTREALNHFQAESQNPEERLTVQNWKIQQATAAYTIASGPNPVNNALDMVVLASLSRSILDETWVGEEYTGARADPVREAYRSVATDAWQLMTGILTEAQTERLRELLKRWREEHPHVRVVADIHFRDFAQLIGASSGEEGKSGGGNLFSMLGIDPFTTLDPAVREIAQSRELAERSIYYMQRAPALLDMQVERLTYQFAVMPETKALLSDVDRVSLVGSASDQLVRTFPEVLAREREALIAQLVRTINDDNATIGALAAQLRTTLQAGTETANAVHGTLDVFERIKAQFGPKPGEPVPQEKGPPFDIRQYTEMLREATNTSRELNTLAQRADTLLPVLRTATQEASGHVDKVLDHLFFLLLLLIFAAATAALLAALAYRRLTARVNRGGSTARS
jgi:hypothetical protein